MFNHFDVLTFYQKNKRFRTGLLKYHILIKIPNFSIYTHILSHTHICNMAWKNEILGKS